MQNKLRLLAIAAVACLLLPAAPVMAAVAAPAGTILNNATGEVGPLRYGLLDDEGKALAQEWRGNSGNPNLLVWYGDGSLYLYRFPSSLSGLVTLQDSTHFRFQSGAPEVSFLEFDLQTGEPVKQGGGFVGKRSVASMTFTPVLIQYKAFMTAGVSVLGYEKIWQPVTSSPSGAFTLLWDDAPASEGGLWDGFVGLFVPQEGYFEDWFQELRDAFDSRTGGAFGLLAYIQAKFEALRDGSLSASSLAIVLPQNHFYQGFPGIRADALSGLESLLGFLRSVLTAIVVVLTAVAFARKLLELIRN